MINNLCGGQWDKAGLRVEEDRNKVKLHIQNGIGPLAFKKVGTGLLISLILSLSFSF